MAPPGPWARLEECVSTPAARRVLKVARGAFTLGVLLYLAHRLSLIGWSRLVFPRTPWFYLAFLGIFLAAPLCEAMVYARLWGRKLAGLLLPMIQKRVYNRDFLDYSGELFLYLWARERKLGSHRRILGAIKDNAILSSLASTGFAVLLLVGLVGSGLVQLTALSARGPVAVAGLLVGGAVLGWLAWRFRRAVLWIDGRAALAVLLAHFLRLAAVHALQLAQWSVALPELPLRTWLGYLALQVVIQRIPMLPSRDLLFLGAGVGIAHGAGGLAPAVAGTLLAASVLDRSLSFGLVAARSSGGLLRPRPQPTPTADSG